MREQKASLIWIECDPSFADLRKYWADPSSQSPGEQVQGSSMFQKQGNISMPYEAVLMDMDGVIIHTQQSIVAFWQHLASEYHIHFTADRDFSLPLKSS